VVWLLAAMVEGRRGVTAVGATLPLMIILFMVTGVVPVLLATNVVVFAVVLKVMLVMLTCSVLVNENVNAPIHAATAMLTATVTAMSMIDATTGLRAFLLLVFIFLFIPPFGTSKYRGVNGDI
jgi:hypothetical protein